MDNCAKDNKNHTVLGLLALLVQEGVVEDVEVRFLFPPLNLCLLYQVHFFYVIALAIVLTGPSTQLQPCSRF